MNTNVRVLWIKLERSFDRSSSGITNKLEFSSPDLYFEHQCQIALVAVKIVSSDPIFQKGESWDKL